MCNLFEECLSLLSLSDISKWDIKNIESEIINPHNLVQFQISFSLSQSGSIPLVLINLCLIVVRKTYTKFNNNEIYITMIKLKIKEL